MIVVFLGPPGAGKGTQAKRLASTMGLRHVSTGDALRSAVERGTPLGKEASRYLDSGQLVPDSTMLGLVGEILDGKEAAGGIILDGFPRTIPQAAGLDSLLEKRGRAVDCTLLLDLDEAEAVRRLTSRASCAKCGAIYNLATDPPRVEGKCDRCEGPIALRTDDVREVIEARFREYKRLTQPVVEYYRSRGSLRTVDGKRGVEEIARDLAAAVRACGGRGAAG